MFSFVWEKYQHTAGRCTHNAVKFAYNKITKYLDIFLSNTSTAIAHKLDGGGIRHVPSLKNSAVSDIKTLQKMFMPLQPCPPNVKFPVQTQLIFFLCVHKLQTLRYFISVMEKLSLQCTHYTLLLCCTHLQFSTNWFLLYIDRVQKSLNIILHQWQHRTQDEW
jgi:hypothetical protein